MRGGWVGVIPAQCTLEPRLCTLWPVCSHPQQILFLLPVPDISFIFSNIVILGSDRSMLVSNEITGDKQSDRFEFALASGVGALSDCPSAELSQKRNNRRRIKRPLVPGKRFGRQSVGTMPCNQRQLLQLRACDARRARREGVPRRRLRGLPSSCAHYHVHRARRASIRHANLSDCPLLWSSSGELWRTRVSYSLADKLIEGLSSRDSLIFNAFTRSQLGLLGNTDKRQRADCAFQATRSRDDILSVRCFGSVGKRCCSLQNYAITSASRKEGEGEREFQTRTRDEFDAIEKKRELGC